VDTLKREISRSVYVVFGVPRGGVVTADTMVRKLSSSSSANAAVEFDIIIPRKLTDPDNKEQGIGGRRHYLPSYSYFFVK
jgi:predicted phosphoribosyltransferase